LTNLGGVLLTTQAYKGANVLWKTVAGHVSLALANRTDNGLRLRFGCPRWHGWYVWSTIPNITRITFTQSLESHPIFTAHLTLLS